MMKQTIISIVIILVLLTSLGYFMVNSFGESNNTVSEDDSTSTTTTDGSSNLGNINPEEIDNSDTPVTQLPKAPIPALNREFVVPEILAEEFRIQILNQHNSIIATLKENPELRGDWLQLALLRKSVEDYVGAEEIWLYMTKVWNLDHVAFGNLGNLYSSELPDIDKALSYFVQALEKRPDNLNYYNNIYNIFRFRLEDNARAISLLEQGEDLLPDEIYFPKKQAEHYRDTGDVENAKKFFQRTLNLAQELSLLDIENYAREELEKI